MKEYKDIKPVIVIGGVVKDYFGEYMAGGMLIALGLHITAEGITESDRVICGNCLGTGIHNGKIFLRTDNLPAHLLGISAKVALITPDDEKALTPYLEAFGGHFNVPMDQIWDKPFVKVECESKRPFSGNYCAQLV